MYVYQNKLPQPSKLKFLLGRHLPTNSFGLGRLFYKSSRQLQNFSRHGDQNACNLEGCANTSNHSRVCLSSQVKTQW